MQSKLYRVCLKMTVLLLVAVPAHAYVDPGAGSLFFQALVGTFAVVMVTARIYWSKIKAVFMGLFAGRRGDKAK